MTRAARDISAAVAEGSLDPGDISAALVDKCLYNSFLPRPDALLRTSGETRLSDFMTWQCAQSILLFEKVLWPDLSFFDLALGVLKFQYVPRIPSCANVAVQVGPFARTRQRRNPIGEVRSGWVCGLMAQSAILFGAARSRTQQIF